MHYYQFNIGDYTSHTARLTCLEDLAYRRLLDLYYLNEKPHTGSVEDIARDIGMLDHLKEVEYVLTKHFPLDGNEWRNKRADEEVRKYQMKRKTASKAGKASGKARQANSSERVLNSVDVPLNQPITNNHKPITNNHIDNTRVETPTESPPKKQRCPYQKIIDLYHEKLPMCPTVVAISDARKRAIKARWANGMYGLDNWEAYFDDVSKSKWLTGKIDPSPGRKQFIADIDFLIRESTIIKTQEGKYHG